MLLCSDMLTTGSSNDSKSSSDITLRYRSNVPLSSTRRDSVTAWSDEDHHTATSSIFPFHLISGCSTAERDMCQFSRTITSQEVQGRIGLRKGMYIDVEVEVGREPPPSLAGFGAWVCRHRCARGLQHHATCRNHAHIISMKPG